jgi:hypothetical protein
MGNYLVDCDVSEMQLRIPKEHAEELVRYFDGRHSGERGCATATSGGRELALESGGGRLILALRGDSFVAEELEVFDDRGAEFFGRVVINLFVVYRGTLRCRLQWGNPMPAGSAPSEVVVDAGRTTWMSPGPTGSWLRPPEPAIDQSEIEAALAKIEEGARYFAEYLRLKRGPVQEKS